VSGYIQVPSTSALQSGASFTQTASCPVGKTVLGGGYSIDTTVPGDAGKVVAVASSPSGTNAWQVQAQLVPGTTLASTWVVTATATCATVAP
jgi:hypothetical protein